MIPTPKADFQRGKQRPLVAPPPAYGNKIVHGHESGEEDVANAASGSAAL